MRFEKGKKRKRKRNRRKNEYTESSFNFFPNVFFPSILLFLTELSNLALFMCIKCVLFVVSMNVFDSFAFLVSSFWIELVLVPRFVLKLVSKYIWHFMKGKLSTCYAHCEHTFVFTFVRL